MGSLIYAGIHDDLVSIELPEICWRRLTLTHGQRVCRSVLGFNNMKLYSLFAFVNP